LRFDGKVLALANKGTSQLEQVSGKPLGQWPARHHIAGRRHMPSQRVARFYLAMARKVPLPNAQAKLDKARAEFVSALDVLANAPEATTAIKQEIVRARTNGCSMRLRLRNVGSDAASPERSENSGLRVVTGCRRNWLRGACRRQRTAGSSGTGTSAVKPELRTAAKRS
jgi:hypothetical protein